jgi:hypothetical protein
MENESLPRLSRRTLLGWFAAAWVSHSAGDWRGLAQSPFAKGYGTDPDLMKIYNPGDLWPLTFSAGQRKTATALADVIFPADHLGPAASAVRVPDFIDEWVSAPYPQQSGDKEPIIEGLAWLDAESQQRFGKGFAELSSEQQRAICDDIAWPPDAKPAFRKPAEFFNRFRNIAAGAYYGSAEGWKAIGYIGNMPTPTFDGPPREVLERLGLEQTIR